MRWNDCGIFIDEESTPMMHSKLAMHLFTMLALSFGLVSLVAFIWMLFAS